MPGLLLFHTAFSIANFESICGGGGRISAYTQEQCVWLSRSHTAQTLGVLLTLESPVDNSSWSCTMSPSWLNAEILPPVSSLSCFVNTFKYLGHQTMPSFSTTQDAS